MKSIEYLKHKIEHFEKRKIEAEKALQRYKEDVGDAQNTADGCVTAIAEYREAIATLEGRQAIAEARQTACGCEMDKEFHKYSEEGGVSAGGFAGWFSGRYVDKLQAERDNLRADIDKLKHIDEQNTATRAQLQRELEVAQLELNANRGIMPARDTSMGDIRVQWLFDTFQNGYNAGKNGSIIAGDNTVGAWLAGQACQMASIAMERDQLRAAEIAPDTPDNAPAAAWIAHALATGMQLAKNGTTREAVISSFPNTVGGLIAKLGFDAQKLQMHADAPVIEPGTASDAYGAKWIFTTLAQGYDRGQRGDTPVGQIATLDNQLFQIGYQRGKSDRHLNALRGALNQFVANAQNDL